MLCRDSVFFRRLIAGTAGGIVAAGLSAVTGTQPAVATDGGRWVVVFNQLELPADVDAQVAAAGGVITERIPQLGAVRAESIDPEFASRMAATQDVRAVSVDAEFQLIPEDNAVPAAPPASPPVDEPNGPTEPPGADPQPGFDNLYNQQWDKMRINASASGSYAVQR